MNLGLKLTGRPLCTLDHNLVAALIFGLVKRLVSTVYKTFHRVMFCQLGYTNRDGDFAYRFVFIGAFQLTAFQEFTQVFAHVDSILQRGVRHQYDEFFSAVAGGDVMLSGVFYD